jgi:hypothetical protein
MDIARSMTDQVFTQCLNMVASDENQEKLKTKVIDPLVTYFKYKLRLFFIIIIVLLSCILVTNILIIGHFVGRRFLKVTTATAIPQNILQVS